MENTLELNLENKYRKLNLIVGWIIFAIAAFVYLSTIEPTASFWDCSEFISTDFKLEVGHPPGAPFLQLIARLVSMLSFGNVHKVAPLINSMSALCSAFAILFLFWTITILAKKLVLKHGALTEGKIYAILGAGAIGALAYTFTDSFWFSAVEGEVYAMSSFFTAVVFWCMFRWERVCDEKHSDRWIVLIAYLIGCSIGVHLLCLLTIPAMVFIFYFKKYEVTPKGLLITSVIAVGLLGGIQDGVIPGIVSMVAKFEIFCVNTLDMPFDVGTAIYFLLIIGGIIWGLYYTKKTNRRVWNTVILCFAALLIGYSTYLVLVIRSEAKTPLNENDPENAVNLLAYLGREQYGSWPLLYGPYYNTPLDPQKPYKDGDPVYGKDVKLGKYVIVDANKNSQPNYDSRFCTIFPRMWDQSDRSHVPYYKQWGDVTGVRKTYTGPDGTQKVITEPTFWENLTYFFSYQINYMYFRYFMWNFSGRQNDVQGRTGNCLDGNWITGIPFIDSLHLGKQPPLPADMKANRGRNIYYGLPFLLGLLGFFYQYRYDKKNTLIVGLLFFFTGLAIILYLNQYPLQPRERDYAYVGSFYAYAMWIGLGALALFDFLKNKLPEKTSAIAVTLICLLAVPAVMAHANWNDHDRSNRYTCRDFAIDYLQSCAPNAILFTNGDNDTFPLWYAQEVEGIRTDVRVCNLELLNTDWYIDQMKRKAYKSDPIPFSLTKKQYEEGTNDYVPIVNRNIKGYTKLKELINFVKSDNRADKIQVENGKYISYFPTNKFELPVNKAEVLKNGTVPASLKDSILPKIDWTVHKKYILKNDLMVLDLLANNDWKRPIYFAVTTGPSAYIGLQNYFQLEGLAYRLVPIKNTAANEQVGQTRVATGIMYNNIMHKFKWGGMNTPGVYLSGTIRSMSSDMRIQMSILAQALAAEGKKDSALKVLDKCMYEMPEYNVPYNAVMFSVDYAYYQAGAVKRPNKLAKRLFDIFESHLKYYYELDADQRAGITNRIKRAQDILQRLIYVTKMFKQDSLSKSFEKRYQQLEQTYVSVGGNNPA